MSRVLYQIAVTILCLWPIYSTPAFAQSSRGTQVLEEIRALYNLPGLAAGVVDNGTLQTAAVGVRKQGDPTLMTTGDIFHLGSNTKAMTATIMARYVEEGRISWNTTLGEFFPNWGNWSRAHQSTTLAMLTSHHSGIRNESANDIQVLINPDFYNVTALDGRRFIVNRILQNPPQGSPGDEFLYSNFNYIIAGYIIDQLGSSWEEAIQSQLFEPLNMTDCGLGPVPQASNTTITQPWPHDFDANGNPIPRFPNALTDNPPAYGPAGTAHCPIASYANFLIFHMNGLLGRPTPFLNATSFAVLHSPFPNATSPYTPGGWLYLGESSQLKGVVLGHTGSNQRNYVLVNLAPGVDQVYMAFTNAGGVGLPGELATGEVVLGLETGNFTLQGAAASASPTGSAPSPTGSSAAVVTKPEYLAGVLGALGVVWWQM